MKQNPLERAHAVHQSGDLDGAEKMYNALLNEQPDHYLVQFFLGTLHYQRGNNGLAINLLSSVLAKHPNMTEAWTNLGCAHRIENRMDLALEAFQKGLEIMGDNSQSYNNIGSCYVAAGEPEIGEEYLRKAVELDVTNAQAQWNLSLVLLEQEKWEEGWRQYDWGFTSKDRLVRNFDCPTWDGKPTDKTVIVYGEQGMGDEILLYSMVNDLKHHCKKVVIECNPRLTHLIARSFPDCDVYGTRKMDWIDWPLKYPDRVAIAAGSLGNYYRLKEADFPAHNGYLKPDFDEISLIKDRMGEKVDRFKIGISWGGGGKKTRNDLRTMPLETMVPLLKELDADLYSFQYTAGAEDEVAAINKKYGLNITHWPEYVANQGIDSEYDKTGALVACMDLVITIPTSIMHLAGGLNVPTIVLNPYESAWREGLNRPNCIWYQNQTTMLRKGKGEAWDRLLLEAKELAQEMIGAKNEDSNVVQSGTVG